MAVQVLEVDFSKLPMFLELKGNNGETELFSLKPASRKLGIQLLKPSLLEKAYYKNNK